MDFDEVPPHVLGPSHVVNHYLGFPMCMYFKHSRCLTCITHCVSSCPFSFMASARNRQGSILLHTRTVLVCLVSMEHEAINAEQIPALGAMVSQWHSGAQQRCLRRHKLGGGASKIASSWISTIGGKGMERLRPFCVLEKRSVFQEVDFSGPRDTQRIITCGEDVLMAAE